MELSDLKQNVTKATSLLKSLANEDRLLLLCQLISGEKAVSELERLTGIRQPTLSQQLGVLRNEGLVATRREGKWIFYRVASKDALVLLTTMQTLFSGEPVRRVETLERKDLARVM